MNPYTKPSTLVRLSNLSFLCASMSWIPMFMVPGIDLPVWLPLTCVGLSAALPAFLNRESWQRFVLSSITGSFVGIFIGNIIWPPEKAPIGIPLFLSFGTVASAIVALPSAFVASRLSVPLQGLRGGAWFALIITAALGPTCIALTPLFVARRVARNEEIAAERILALQRAVERTSAASFDRAEICNGSVLAKNYTGPAFSDEDWRRIVGNYVRQDGYIFMIYCQKKSVYRIDARPFREQEDGNRRFCMDESGKMGCGDRNHWDVCVPCSK